MSTNAPIDPETGLPVRNWPTARDLVADKRAAAVARRDDKRAAAVARRDDKGGDGNWTLEAVARYGNRYNDGSCMTGTCGECWSCLS